MPRKDRSNPHTSGPLAPASFRGALDIAQREAKWRARAALRFVKMIGLMIASAFIIPITMISLGLLLGPRGHEGIVVAPLAVFASWGLILFFGLRRRATRKKIARAPLKELPNQVGEWLQRYRLLLPPDAMQDVDGIFHHLEHLGPQLEVLEGETPATTRLRRLLCDDLTGLIDHYRRLPPRLRTQALHGGPSPERQLVSGLSTIHAELGRVHDELANEDLYSLATKQRYLELKYGNESKKS